MSDELVKVRGRLAFPNIFDPHPESGRYNCLVLFDANDGQAERLEAKALEVCKAKWNGKVTKPAQQLRQYFLHDGEEKAQYEGFGEGTKYVSASSEAPPGVKARDGRTNVGRSSGLLYAGCEVVCYISIWAQDNQYGKGINAQLMGVQYYGEGERFGAARPAMADEMFEAFDEEEEEDVFA
jgi:hypothetical protein